MTKAYLTLQLPLLNTLPPVKNVSVAHVHTAGVHSYTSPCPLLFAVYSNFRNFYFTKISNLQQYCKTG